MRKLNLDWADIFISDDIWREEYSDAEREGLEDLLTVRFDHMLFEHLDPDIHGYIDEVKRQSQSSKKKFGILHAHGGSSGGQGSWFYVDGAHQLNLQEWIDRNSGRYFCLVLASCNRAALTPKSDRTMLLLPDRPFAIWSASEGAVSWSLVHGNKAIDTYTVAHELNALKDKGEINARVKAAKKAKATGAEAKLKTAKVKSRAKPKRRRSRRTVRR